MTRANAVTASGSNRGRASGAARQPEPSARLAQARFPNPPDFLVPTRAAQAQPDTTPPTVTNSLTDNRHLFVGNMANGATPIVGVNVSEDVRGFSAGDLTASAGSPGTLGRVDGQFCTVPSFALTSGSRLVKKTAQWQQECLMYNVHEDGIRCLSSTMGTQRSIPQGVASDVRR